MIQQIHETRNIPDTQEVLNILDIILQPLTGEIHAHLCPRNSNKTQSCAAG